MIRQDGVPKILDFGLARIERNGQEPSELDSQVPTVTMKQEDVPAAPPSLTQGNSILGTPAYMSPEQIEGKKVDRRTDLFSFGLVMYEALTGERPFKGDSQLELISKILQADPQPVTGLRPDVPVELEHIVHRALQKNPESRYSSSELLKDLEDYQNRRQAEALGVFNLHTFLRRIRKPRITVPAMGLILLIILVVARFFDRQADIRWATEVALPEIERLVETNWRDFTEAYKLAEQAEAYIPNNPKL